MKLFQRKTKEINCEKKITKTDAELDSLASSEKSWRDFVKDPRKMLDLPTPLYALIMLKSDQDRIEYLSKLPKTSLTTIGTAMMFIMLKVDVIEKAVKLGIKVPDKVIEFVDGIRKQVYETGELTVQNVKSVVQNVKDITMLLTAISMTVFVITTPGLLPVILPIFAMVEFKVLFNEWMDDMFE